MFFSDFMSILNAKSYQQTYGYIGKHKPLDPAKPVYLTVNLESVYIPYVRKGIDKFYATLYGSVSLSPSANEKASFQAVDVLSSLPDIKELDAKHLDRIALGPYRLLDDVPYRFEGLYVNLCLFSVQSSSLAGPYIDLLKSIAEAAGVAFLSQAAPLADAIRKGITGLVGPNELEIGRCGLFDPVESGYYAVVRTDQTPVPLDELSFDPKTRKLTRNGAPLLDYPYFVLRFLPSDVRENWKCIPKISEAFYAMRDQFNRTPKDFAVNQKLFDMFECAVMLSADLLEDDALSLVHYMREKYRFFLTPLIASSDAKTSGEANPMSKEILQLSETVAASVTSDSSTPSANEVLTQSLDDIDLFLRDDE